MDEGVEGVDDEDRMRDLANLSIARTYYSASITLDAETNAPNVNSTKLSAAVKYWNSVDQTSEYWLDALFEESWAYFMAGDYAHALGNAPSSRRTSELVLPRSGHPLASSTSRTASTTTPRSSSPSSVEIPADLRRPQPVLGRFKGDEADEPFYKFRDVRDDKARRRAHRRSQRASDRQLLRHLSYVQVLDDEAAFGKAPEASGLATGNDVKDSCGSPATSPW
jgi:hypothetical protein